MASPDSIRLSSSTLNFAPLAALCSLKVYRPLATNLSSKSNFTATKAAAAGAGASLAYGSTTRCQGVVAGARRSLRWRASAPAPVGGCCHAKCSGGVCSRSVAGSRRGGHSFFRNAADARKKGARRRADSAHSKKPFVASNFH